MDIITAKGKLGDKDVLKRVPATGVTQVGPDTGIVVEYYNPQKQDDAMSIQVDGFLVNNKIRDEKNNRIKHPFSGTLVKGFGGGFKDVSKELTDSLEEANQKVGNTIEDTYGIVNERIVKSVPFNDMDNFFRGIKEKSSPSGTKNKKQVLDWDKGQHVKLNLDLMNKKNQSVYDKVFSVYPDIEENPYGIVWNDNGTVVTVVFKNNKWSKIPKKFLSASRAYDIPDATEESRAKDVYKYYSEERNNPENDMSLEFVQQVIDYKNDNGIKIDDIDNSLLSKKKLDRENDIKEEEELKKKDKGWKNRLFEKFKGAK